MSTYSLGTSSQVKTITYAGEGKAVLTAAVKLRMQGKTLKLSTIEEDLNNSSPNSVTWSKSLLANTINTIIIKTFCMQDQLLLLTLAEDFTSPTNRDQLLKITKEKGIQAIMDNTVIDPIKNKVQVNCLYKPNLPNLGENYFLCN